jgi:hypothetical protein
MATPPNPFPLPATLPAGATAPFETEAQRKRREFSQALREAPLTPRDEQGRSTLNLTGASPPVAEAPPTVPAASAPAAQAQAPLADDDIEEPDVAPDVAPETPAASARNPNEAADARPELGIRAAQPDALDLFGRAAPWLMLGMGATGLAASWLFNRARSSSDATTAVPDGAAAVLARDGIDVAPAAAPAALRARVRAEAGLGDAPDSPETDARAVQHYFAQREARLPLLARPDGSAAVDVEGALRELYGYHYTKLASDDPPRSREDRNALGAAAMIAARQDVTAAMAVGGTTLPWVITDPEGMKEWIMGLPAPIRPLAATFIPMAEVVQTGSTSRVEFTNSSPLALFGRLGVWNYTVAPEVAKYGAIRPGPERGVFNRLAVAAVNPLAAAGIPSAPGLLMRAADERSVEGIMRGEGLIDAQPQIAARIKQATGTEWARALSWAAVIGLIFTEPDALGAMMGGVGAAGKLATRGLTPAGRSRRLAAALEPIAAEIRQAPAGTSLAKLEEAVARLDELEPGAGGVLRDMVHSEVAAQIVRRATPEETAVTGSAVARGRNPALAPQLQEIAQEAADARQARAGLAQTIQGIEQQLPAKVLRQADPVEAARLAVQQMEAQRLAWRAAAGGARADAGAIARAAKARAALQKGVAAAAAGKTVKNMPTLRANAVRYDAAARLARSAPALARLKAHRDQVASLIPARAAAIAERLDLEDLAMGERIYQNALATTVEKVGQSFGAYADGAEAAVKAADKTPLQRAVVRATDKGTEVHAAKFRAALEDQFGPAAIQAFLVARPREGAVLQQLLGAGQAVKALTAQEVDEIDQAVIQLAAATERFRVAQGGSARAEAFWTTYQRAPRAAPSVSLLQPRTWVVAGAREVRRAARIFDAQDQTVGVMARPLQEVLRVHSERLDMFMRDLTDLAHAIRFDDPDGPAKLSKSIMEYLTTNAPMQAKRGPTRGNIGQEALFATFLRWTRGLTDAQVPDLTNKALTGGYPVLKRLAHMWLDPDVTLAADVEAKLVTDVVEIVQQMARQPTTALPEVLAQQIRAATEAAGVGLRGAAGVLPPEAALRAHHALFEAVTYGASEADTYALTIRALGGTVSPEAARDASRLLDSRDWKAVADADAAWQAIATFGVPVGSKLRNGAEGLQPVVVRLAQATADAERVVVPQAFVDAIEEATAVALRRSKILVESPLWRSFATYVRLLKTSFTTGLILPNAKHAVNTGVGDFSQMWLTLGVRRAAQVSFQGGLAAIPFIGRKLQDASSEFGRDGTRLMEALFDPDFGRLMQGRTGFMVDRHGVSVPYNRLVREMEEQSIHDNFLGVEIAAYRYLGFDQGTLPALYGRHQENINEFFTQYASRQRGLLYVRLRRDGMSAAEAGKMVRDTLYDWKAGLSKLEATHISTWFMFYRFMKLSTKQALTAFTTPFVKPDLAAIAGGTTQIARARQQIQLAQALPTWLMQEAGLGAEEQTAFEERRQLETFFRPAWARTRTGWMSPASVFETMFYRNQEGRSITHEFHLVPQMTILDSFGLLLRTLALTGAVTAAAASDDVVLPADFLPQFMEENIWSMLGPEAEIAELALDFMQHQDDARLASLTPGEAALLRALGSWSPFGAVGQDAQGRPTGNYYTVNLLRRLMPLIGTQIPPLLTQVLRSPDQQRDWKLAVRQMGLHVTGVVRDYPVDVEAEYDRHQRAVDRVLDSRVKAAQQRADEAFKE